MSGVAPEIIAQLPALNVMKDNVTSVGFSAGSNLSMQLHLAYSDMFKGVGLLAGRAYSSRQFIQETNRDTEDIHPLVSWGTMYDSIV